jgi:hypothetical protein
LLVGFFIATFAPLKHTQKWQAGTHNQLAQAASLLGLRVVTEPKNGTKWQ